MDEPVPTDARGHRAVCRTLVGAGALASVVLAALLAVLTAAVLAVLTTAAPAHASCADDSGPQGSDVVFLGTPLDHRGGYTRLEVKEVWSGPDLAPTVWVRSGQDQPPWPFSLVGTSSSLDATLEEGTDYVVGASAGFSTSECRVFEAEAATALRPSEVRRPTAGGAQGADPPAGPWSLAAGAAAVLAAVAAATYAWRLRRARSRRQDRPRIAL